MNHTIENYDWFFVNFFIFKDSRIKFTSFSTLKGLFVGTIKESHMLIGAEESMLFGLYHTI